MRVVASSGEELRCGVRADTEHAEQCRGVSGDEFGDAGFEATVLVVEEPDPASELAEREAGLELDRVRVVVGEPARPAELRSERQAVAEPVAASSFPARPTNSESSKLCRPSIPLSGLRHALSV